MTWKLFGKIVIGTISIASAVVLVATNDPTVIRMQGPCEPISFNLAVGPGTCIGDGPITFAHFIAELTHARNVGLWHFDPNAGALAPGTVLSLENLGGELHTFTKVAEFGGGFIDPLNQLSGNPIPAPECLANENPSNIYVEAKTTEVGPTAGSSILPRGTKTKFQCCIHPRMRTELTTK